MIYDVDKFKSTPLSRMSFPNADFSDAFSEIGKVYDNQLTQVKEDYSNIEQNLSNLDSYKTILDTKFISPLSKDRFNDIVQNRYQIGDQSFKPSRSQLTQPGYFDNLGKKIKQVYQDPEVRELFKEDTLADQFRRNINSIDPTLRPLAQKVWSDYTTGNVGVNALNPDLYQKIDVDLEAAELLSKAPKRRYQVQTDRGLETREGVDLDALEYQLRALGQDQVFRNNLQVDPDYQGDLDKFVETYLKEAEGMGFSTPTIKYGSKPKTSGDEKVEPQKPLKRTNLTDEHEAKIQEYANKNNLLVEEILANRDLVKRIISQPVAGEVEEEESFDVPVIKVNTADDSLYIEMQEDINLGRVTKVVEKDGERYLITNSDQSKNLPKERLYKVGNDPIDSVDANEINKEFGDGTLKKGVFWKKDPYPEGFRVYKLNPNDAVIGPNTPNRQGKSLEYGNLKIGPNDVNIPKPSEREKGKKNVSWYTNNPLNLKGDPTQVPVVEGVDYEGDGLRHRVFPDLETGLQAAINDIEAKLSGNSRVVSVEDTLSDMYKVFATSANESKIKKIAAILNVSPNITLKELAEKKTPREVAMAIMSIEAPEIYDSMNKDMEQQEEVDWAKIIQDSTKSETFNPKLD